LLAPRVQPTIRTSFRRDVAPFTISTRFLGTEKAAARTSRTCSFALPLSGGAATRTLSVPSSVVPATSFLAAPGTTLTLMIRTDCWEPPPDIAPMPPTAARSGGKREPRGRREYSQRQARPLPIAQWLKQ